jgi:hypothetical protein
MKELRRFSARLWMEADDNKLRTLAITGMSARACCFYTETYPEFLR